MARKNVYEDFASLLGELQYDLIDVSYEVAEEIKEIEKEVIEEVVYNAYEPRFYERRQEKGGLSDKANMQEEIDLTKDGLSISVKNVTKGNSEYSKTEGYTDGCISDIIEDGKGYGYDLDDYIGARPFQEVTQEHVDGTDRVDNVIDKMLNKKGW